MLALKKLCPPKGKTIDLVLFFLQFINYQSTWEVDNTKTMYGVIPSAEE